MKPYSRWDETVRIERCPRSGFAAAAVSAIPSSTTSATAANAAMPATAPFEGLPPTSRTAYSLKRSALPTAASALKTPFGGLIARISSGYSPISIAA